MDKTAIKNFAVWARVKLMDDIKTRLGFLGITEEGIQNPLPASTPEVQYFDIGSDNPIAVKGVAIRQRKDIVDIIREGEQESGLGKAFHNFVEASAYEWFNRLVAIRYMEINEYAPLDMRILSSVEKGKQDPDLVSTPFDGSLEYTEQEEQRITQWKAEHDNKKLFRFLLFKMCNQLHKILPGIFEGKDDASELLFRQSFIDKDGVIYHLVNDIAEEDWKDQVQIIGWIYQYYNSELKDQIFAKKAKVTKDELPAVTQLFTPDWIVRYMVENSLGRLWIEHLRGLNPDVDEKETAEKFGWKYYLPEAKQEPEVEQQLAKIREEYATLKPEDLSCLDPCMGSGHILVYMFDVLEQIYTSVGYSEREAAKAILENNIYGLDIDDRAYQLAYFAVMMKARQYNRRILTSGIKAHVYSIQESNGITKNQLQEMGESLSPEKKKNALSQAEKLVELFHDAKEYGSILNIPEMDWDLLRRFATPKETIGQTSLNLHQEASKRMLQLVDQGEVMAKKYWVTCTNPPYMGNGNMSSSLSEFVKRHYATAKRDLYTTFIVKCGRSIKDAGFIAMITQQGWMFINSYEDLRYAIITNNNIISMIHLGPRAFEEIGGEVVQTTSFVIRGTRIEEYISSYARLVDFNTQYEKEAAYVKSLSSKENIYFHKSKDFSMINKNPIAYWLNRVTLLDFASSPSIGNEAFTCYGLLTGHDDGYIFHWYEVDFAAIGFNCKSIDEFNNGSNKYVPLCKGGIYKKWYGNRDLVVRYDETGIKGMSQYPKYASNGKEKYFQEGITWAEVCMGRPSFRYMPFGNLFSLKGPCLFVRDKSYLLKLLGYLNTNVSRYFVQLLNPTISCGTGVINRLPLKRIENVDTDLVEENIEISKNNYDCHETSFDFRIHPLINGEKNIERAFNNWKERNRIYYETIKHNEEILNRYFIDAYELENTLTAQEEQSDVTLTIPTIESDITSLISYAIGCMFGRYSLDKEGLIYAGGDWKSVQSVYKTFLPDQDNVIPLTDQKYLDDDVVERICEFLTVVYGADTLEENLDFIAKALGNKGLTSREVIRNYMLNSFFKDHCKTYSVTGSGKRPIYWLFDSGKQNAFKALVYMHRWNEDTTGRVLMYAQEIQKKYETEVRAIDMMLDHMTDSRQAATEEKRREHLQKQLTELIDYEERLTHMANERISIDLDDGVKVNYEKVQTDRNGKKYQILAPIK